MIHDLIGHRNILKLMVYRDLKMRYAGSLLGVTWNIIHPILMVAVYIVVFGTLLAGRGGAGAEMARSQRAIHICAGIIPWMLFAEILTRSSTVLLENSNFLRKLSFPAIILPLSVFVNAVTIYGIASVFLIGILFLTGAPLGGVVSLYFVILVGTGLLALGLGLFISVLNVYLRDLGQFVAIFLQLFFWFNPIVYSKADIGSVTLQRIIEYNPLHHYIVAAQAACYASPVPKPDVVPLMVLLPIVALMLGARFFAAQRRAVLDEL